MPKLRIVIAGGLGDCLLHTPFIRHFRESGEYEDITCMAPKGALELFDRNPRIDHLIGCEGDDLAVWAAPEADCTVFAPYIRSQVITRPDGSVAFRADMGWVGSRESSMLRHVAEEHGLQLANESLEIFTAPEDELWADGFVGGVRQPIIVLNRRTSSSFKEYPRARWQSVVDDLRDSVTMLEFSAPADAMKGVECIWPLLTLRRAAALFRRVRCVVTVDSFSGHLASAVGTPAVVLFGPSSPKVFGHPRNWNIRLDACPPCFHPDEVGCRQPECITEIAPSMVTDAVRAILSGSWPCA
jgi:ADP-heptose:LPS heptosyltransferase